jgi:hypothetical protein
MAFCNSCGATLADGTKFCNKCGATVTGFAAPKQAAPGMTPPPPASTGASTGGSSALKIILIVVGVIVVIGVLGIATISFIGYRIAKSSHVTQNGDNVKVETPFGSVDTTQDPNETAKSLGIDIYPGAEAQRGGSSSVTFGSFHTATVQFRSDDSADKVCAFYKQKFPSAMVTSMESNHCTIVSSKGDESVTINVDARGDGSEFHIAKVNKK